MKEFPVAVFELSGYSDSVRKEAARALALLSQRGGALFSENRLNGSGAAVEQPLARWLGAAWEQIRTHGGTIAIQFCKSGILAYGAEVLSYQRLQRVAETPLLYILLLEEQTIILPKSGLIDGTDLAFQTFLEEQGIKIERVEWFPEN